MDEVKLVKDLFLMIEESVPEDCRDLIIKRLKESFMKEVKNLGVEKAIKKWLNEDEEEAIILY